MSFRGHPMGAGAYLSIQSPEEWRPALELPLLDGTDVDVESLEVGRYRVAVQVGRWFEEPLVLGTSEVEVVAGRLSSVVLTLDQPPAVQLGSLDGKVVIPSGWPPGDLSLSFHLHGTALGGQEGMFYLGDLTRTSDEPAVYEWSVPEIQAGRWEIEFSDPPCQTIVDFEPGRHSLVIEVLVPHRFACV